jgi:hypothetical protein
MRGDTYGVGALRSAAAIDVFVTFGTYRFVLCCQFEPPYRKTGALSYLQDEQRQHRRRSLEPLKEAMVSSASVAPESI